MSQARTTVVIGTRDRAEILLRTLEHLLALEPRPPIIVLDDDSHDDTVERLHELRQDAANVRVIRMRSDVPAVARNLGVDLARTPFVALCADEMYWAPDALRTAEELFDAHEELGLITAKVLDPASGELDSLCAEMARLPAVGNAQLPGPSLLRFHKGPLWCAGEPTWIPAVSTRCCTSRPRRTYSHTTSRHTAGRCAMWTKCARTTPSRRLPHPARALAGWSGAMRL